MDEGVRGTRTEKEREDGEQVMEGGREGGRRKERISISVGVNLYQQQRAFTTALECVHRQ